ncbi:MAG: FAD-binding oxidoreductase [Archangium sp.]|nr:FAD-binding oxidoreductase [Archangium sp.]MDP3151234.1 FAD-binding oxidoreductase [Archangium sp.]MDP3570125.1 FAD-binding oxidoreductase [Archangium sp.]
MQAFLDALAREFPADFSSKDPTELATYGKDWTKVFSPAPSLLVRPRTTDEVSRFLKLASDHGLPVVPSGGRTGLAGGAVAAKGEIVLSLERMRAIHAVDPLALTVHVEAGAITEAVHHACAEHGLFWPVDFASKGSSQVGGNIATNAGGVRVIRYGLTRQWVLGLTVVTMAGERMELNGALEKNNTGVDLRQLFIGSEGILGVITEATLKLTRQPGKVDVFLFALDSLQGVLKLFEEARRGPFTMMAYEFFTEACSRRLEKHRGLRPPFEKLPSHCVLLEVEDAKPGALDGWLASLFERGLVLDGTLAADVGQQKALWALREGISESLSATGLPHKNDIALPVAKLSVFCGELETLLASRYPDWELCLFGHIGDGNLHVNIMKPEEMSKEDFFARTHDVDRDMFGLVRSHKGSVSAEHGIGLLKKEWLEYTRSPMEIDLMRHLKAALDPKGLLNPGKVL